MKTSYDQKVIQGRKLVRRTEADQWELAELTWRAVEDDGRSANAWANDTGMSSHHAQRLYRAWKYKIDNVSRGQFLIFSDVYALVHIGEPETDDPAEARQQRYESTAINTIRKASPAKRADIVRELLTDPEVAKTSEDEIVELVSSSPSLTARTIERASEKRPAPAKPVHEPNALDYVAALGVGSTAVMAMRKLHADVSTLVAVLRNESVRLDDGSRAAIGEDATHLRQAADIARLYADELDIALEGGVSDERLSEVLDGWSI